MSPYVVAALAFAAGASFAWVLASHVTAGTIADLRAELADAQRRLWRLARDEGSGDGA